MQTTWMKLLAATTLGIAAACGGSSGNAALSKSFNYGAATAPTTSESQAATSAQGSLADTSAFSSTPDAARGFAIVSFADSLAALAFGGAAVPVRGPDSPQIQRAMRNAFDLACATTTASGVTFTNCQISESGFTLTLNGSIHVSAGAVTWNITGGFSGVEQGYTINVTNHQAGTLALTGTTIKGNATSDFGGSVSGNGQSVNFGLATAVVIDVTFQTAPSMCVTSGTVEVKRVWTAKPNGASGAQFADVGVKLTWTGCGTLTVAHST